MEQERLTKGIWIPIEIWKDKKLTWNEKILFLEIDSYTSKDKDCFFSNEYISELLGISQTNANKVLSSLIKKGYVIKTKFDGRKRYIKSALSYSTTLPCQERQGSHAHVDNNIYNIDSKEYNKLDNKEEKELKEKSDALFEECWIAYRRKGRKGKAKPYWDKLTDKEKKQVLPHIRAYVQSKELQYQQDFERYLRDKTFLSVVFKGNIVVFDPTIGTTQEYHPATDGNIRWLPDSNCYKLIGMYWGEIWDGYTDENRPNGAQIMLSNGQGMITWNSENKKWEHE